MEEFEIQRGFNRAKLEERVSVLAQYPVDFVVHATAPRWYKPKTYKTPASTGSSTSVLPCTRLYGLNETMRKHPALRKSFPRIKHVRVIGERNTGTRTLIQDLAKSLRNTTVDSGITRWGYWFQDPALLSPVEHFPNETLVIHVVLDPVEWFARMQANPIHAPYHRKTSDVSSWNSSTFFKRPWTLPRPEWDDPRPAQGHCQYRFPLDAVVPCAPGHKSGAKANKFYPVYEMNPEKNAPFPTIVHLRSAKLLNHLNVSTWMPHVVHVRSPDIAGINGVNAFISALLDRFRFSTACEIHKREPVKSSTPASSTADPTWSEHPPEPLTNWQTKFVLCNLNWDVEKLFGFAPKEDLKTACPHGYVGHQREQLGSLKNATSEKGILFRFMDGISNFGRRRERRRRE